MARQLELNRRFRVWAAVHLTNSSQLTTNSVVQLSCGSILASVSSASALAVSAVRASWRLGVRCLDECRNSQRQNVAGRRASRAPARAWAIPSVMPTSPRYSTLPALSDVESPTNPSYPLWVTSYNLTLMPFVLVARHICNHCSRCMPHFRDHFQ